MKFKILLYAIIISIVSVFIYPVEGVAGYHAPKSQNYASNVSNKPSGKSTKNKKPQSRTKEKSNENTFLEKHWYKSSFPTVKDSVKYHVKKHGNGRNATQYTKDGIAFYQKNKHKRKNVTLHDGTPGYKIENGKAGGYWTREGKLVTYWG